MNKDPLIPRCDIDEILEFLCKLREDIDNAIGAIQGTDLKNYSDCNDDQVSS
jgi:hypothetical protein